MSLLKQSDYLKESKHNKVVSPKRASHGGIATLKKAKLPTQYRTTKHKCSQCPRTDAKKYSISEKEVRWLCPVCVIRNKNKDSKEIPNFIPASKLRFKN